MKKTQQIQNVDKTFEKVQRKPSTFVATEKSRTISYNSDPISIHLGKHLNQCK